MRILLINDEPDLLMLAQMGLEQIGHRVETLTEAGKALDVVRRFHPDVIGLDWVTPGTSGEDVLRQLKAEPDTAAIPVVVATALSGIDTHARLLGAETVVHKPFTISQLAATLQRVVMRQEGAACMSP